MKTLTKKELQIINKALGYLISAEEKGELPDYVTDIIESDEFNDLNEKIAEAIAS